MVQHVVQIVIECHELKVSSVVLLKTGFFLVIGSQSLNCIELGGWSEINDLILSTNVTTWDLNLLPIPNPHVPISGNIMIIAQNRTYIHYPFSLQSLRKINEIQ